MVETRDGAAEEFNKMDGGVTIAIASTERCVQLAAALTVDKEDDELADAEEREAVET